MLSGVASAQSAQTSQGDKLELAFNGHCRECPSFVKDDNRIGLNLYA